ncbi:DegT/DnrJ/EryC1/StrS family aminotransferase [Candidatus Woesebacteria bacterium]|nr:MAG: DegT/DnrJ/EryC1/StrS family aminotransferase [Candidatus Woesebacteria bacterium]
MQTVQFVDLKRQYRELKPELDKVVKQVQSSGRYLFGEEVTRFENYLATYIGVKYAVGVHSGTDALTIAIQSLGLGKNDEVLVPANVYPTAFGVSHSGVQIKLVDVDPESLLISVNQLQASITNKTKAIVVVHLYGNPAQIIAIKKFANKHKLFLIEDCAQSIGARYNDRKVGTFGDVACFSFYPTKNLGAHGDGGAILTNNKKISDKAKLWRMYGEKSRYNSVLVGYNSRLDETQAAILNVKIKYLEKWNKRRRELAKIYQNGLKDLPIVLLPEAKRTYGVYHLLVIRVKHREKIIKYLSDKGIASAVHYPKPIHLTPSYKHLGNKTNSFPVSEASCKEVLSLPIYPQMRKREVLYVIKTLKEYYQ